MLKVKVSTRPADELKIDLITSNYTEIHMNNTKIQHPNRACLQNRSFDNKESDRQAPPDLMTLKE